MTIPDVNLASLIIAGILSALEIVLFVFMLFLLDPYLFERMKRFRLTKSQSQVAPQSQGGMKQQQIPRVNNRKRFATQQEEQQKQLMLNFNNN